MANPNIVGVQTVKGKTSVRRFVKKTPVDFLVNNTNSGEILKVNSIYVANRYKLSVNVTIQMNGSSTQGVTQNIVDSVIVASNTSMVLVSKNTDLYLAENSKLSAFASISDQISLVCSYEQISDGFPAERNDNITESRDVAGESIYTTPGSYSWVAPANITSVAVVCVGGGGGGHNYFGHGGGGGALAYKNNVTVVPGSSYAVTVGAGGIGRDDGTTSASGRLTTQNGGFSRFVWSGGQITAGGGLGGLGYNDSRVDLGGKPSDTFDGGGSGGTSGPYSVGSPYYNSGGGGAGGYGGKGGDGASSSGGGNGTITNASAGVEGGGGGGGSSYTTTGADARTGAGGGGVGLTKRGSNGTAGSTVTSLTNPVGGGGGSGGSKGQDGAIVVSGQRAGKGGDYGGGGGSNHYNGSGHGGNGANGAVRIVWGPSLSFPDDSEVDLGDIVPVEYLIVAGGGGGGGHGGGGAGGFYTSTVNIEKGISINVSVGSGGTGAPSRDSQGGDGGVSLFHTVQCAGGGGGGSPQGGLPIGRSGGSGGGGANFFGGQPGGTGNTPSLNPSQGNNGGSGAEAYAGGGGGGAGAVGGNASGNLSPAPGGQGVSSSITGTATVYAGGGGGGSGPGGTIGAGGSSPSTVSGSKGGAGDGSNQSGVAGGAGQSNTGGGGGGGGRSGGGDSASIGGNGGSGVVIIAYPNTYPALTSISGGLSYDTPTRSGYRVYRFTAGTGTIVFG